MRLAAAGILAASCVLSSIASAKDEICDRLQTFYSAPFSSTNGSSKNYRYVEVHWIGAWLDLDHGWKLECRTAGDDPAKALCGWLQQNTSYEFERDLPLRILGCHGFVFPHPYPSISFGHTEVDLFRNGRNVVLDIDFRERKAAHAGLRLTVFAENHDAATDQLKPIIDDPANPSIKN